MVKSNACHHEKDGSPRRIIDYKKLNNAISLQKNITKSPFMCASDCPPGKKKSILDAKDGYHSVVLEKEESRAVTEFLCEFGRYRCIGSGQGLICSGDGYTHRFDNITSKFQKLTRCVDDSLLWEGDMRTSFDLVCRYLTTCSRGTDNFNRQKFKFAEDVVDYVGSTITRGEIKVAASMTESIRNFPAPKNITQARAFFGLVEQVLWAFSKCKDMKHFRHLLSPKTLFVWTEELQKEFLLAKANIVRKIEKGVKMFEVNRITALVCDRSKEGQSLGLWQKHCSCAGPTTILCCRGGWHIVFMSSWFNNDAQSRYSSIEGKCMTLFWAINKCDYYIYSCDKLFVGTDHRPLLAFFRKDDPKPLDHISNKRLRRYVAEIGELRFTIFHFEGAKNYLADRGSGLPSGSAGNDKGDGAAGEGTVPEYLVLQELSLEQIKGACGLQVFYPRMIFHVIQHMPKYLLTVPIAQLRMQKF